MSPDSVRYSDTRDLPIESILALYRANEWSSAEKPELLHKALLASHSLVTAWDDTRLIGLGNSISDGYLVVYYPHLLVLPEYQRCGIGLKLMRRLMSRYKGFHQHYWSPIIAHLTFIVNVDLSVLARPSLCGFMRGTTINQNSHSVGWP